MNEEEKKPILVIDMRTNPMPKQEPKTVIEALAKCLREYGETATFEIASSVDVALVPSINVAEFHNRIRWTLGQDGNFRIIRRQR